MAVIDSKLLQAVILTKDEEPNLERVLSKLNWLEKVIILDTFSVDATLEIAKEFANVEVFQRKFDTHAGQWNYGLNLTASKWILSLDADYVLTDEMIGEIKEYIKSDEFSAYQTDFKFLVFGKELVNDNTTPRPVLFKKADCRYFDDGHTQRLEVNGKQSRFKSFILHDDRKSLSRWLSNQSGYSIKECRKLLDTKPEELSLTAKIRKTKVFAPVFRFFFYCLFVQRLIFSGWHGWYYTLQRTMVEMLFALRLIEETKFKTPATDSPATCPVSNKHPKSKMQRKRLFTGLSLFYVSMLIYLVFFTPHRWYENYHPRADENLLPFVRKFHALYNYQLSNFAELFDLVVDTFGNFLAFIPLPFVLRFIKIKSYILILIVSTLISGSIEILQYVFQIGVTDIDDVILNSLGAAAGIWLLSLLTNKYGDGFNEIESEIERVRCLDRT